jgi:hypothetical protein
VHAGGSRHHHHHHHHHRGYRMQEGDAPASHADLMGYWLDKDFYCRR